MFGLGTAELFIIFLIIFLLFGAKNLPEIAKSLGKAMRSFKKGVEDIEEDINADLNKDEKSEKSKDDAVLKQEGQEDTKKDENTIV